MRRFNIKFLILSIVMVPVVLIDVFLTSVNINSGIQQAEDQLQSKGSIIAKQLAGAAEFNLFSGNYGQIQRLLDQSVNTNDIVFAAVYDNQGNTLATAIGRDYEAEQSTNYFYYRQPIQTESLGTQDIFTPEPLAESNQLSNLGWVHLYVSKQQLEQTKREILIEGAIFFCSMLVLAVFLTLLISRRITRPISTLLEHLRQVEAGQLGEIIKDIENNEIGDVQNGFNSMSQSLLANRMQLDEKINSATLDLMNAISDLEYNNRELAIARDIAQKADEVKSRFLANMSHEIRTPINGIKGFVNLLAKSGLNTDQKRYADIISQSTNDLTLIVNEVLDLSKIESGKIDILQQPFDLYELLETTRDSLFTVALDKNIDLHLIIYSDTPAHVIADELRLKQILINLIGNAIKFTDQGYVAIKVMVEDQSNGEVLIRFDIKDSGIGIDETDQKTLFQAFKQLESDANRRYSGTGLGLVIAKNLTRLMQGDIDLTSAPDEGSLFSVHLPVKPDPNYADQPQPETQQTVMIFACNTLCANEIQSLFDRVGFNTECQLIDAQTQADQLSEQLRQNLDYIDLIVIDLRHNRLQPESYLDQDVLRRCRVIVMHYDISLIDQSRYRDYQFVSVINTSSNLQRLLFNPSIELEKTTDVSEAVTLHCPNKILLVDDNPINLKLASELTRMWGHESFEANDARQAMSLFNSETFDLILLDIQMPEIDGIELMHMMRRQKPNMLTPIVAVTAISLESEQERLIKLGFDAFISKPIDEDKFRRLLDQETFIFEDEFVTEQLSDKDASIDYELTVKLSANNKALAEDIFRILQLEIPDYQTRLTRAVEREDFDQLALIMHKIQGVTCYAGLPRLKNLVSQFAGVKKFSRKVSLAICKEVIEELQLIQQELQQHALQPGSVEEPPADASTEAVSS